MKKKNVKRLSSKPLAAANQDDEGAMARCMHCRGERQVQQRARESHVSRHAALALYLASAAFF